MSDRFVPLAISADLKTPLSVVDPIHLEGVLYDTRFHRDPTTMGTPLDCIAYEQGIPKVSAGFLVDEGMEGVAWGETKVIRSIDLRVSDVYKIVTKGQPRKHTVIDAMSEFRSKLAAYPTLGGTPKIVFQALGNREGIENLLQDVASIGKLRKRGYGHVTQWLVEEIDVDPKDCGWFADGRLLRRLPADIVRSRLGKIPSGVSVQQAKLEPPFWCEQELVEIAAPTLKSVMMPNVEINDLLQPQAA